MSQNIGTLVIAPIRPNDSLDTYPTALSNEIKGGLHSYPLYTDLLNIPTARRQPGMLVNIYDDLPVINGGFKLLDDLTTWEYFTDEILLTGKGYGYQEPAFPILSVPYCYLVTKTKIYSQLSNDITLGLNGTNLNLITLTCLPNAVTTSTSTLYIDFDPTNEEPCMYITATGGGFNYEIELKRVLPQSSQLPTSYPSSSLIFVGAI